MNRGNPNNSGIHCGVEKEESELTTCTLTFIDAIMEIPNYTFECFMHSVTPPGYCEKTKKLFTSLTQGFSRWPLSLDI